MQYENTLIAFLFLTSSISAQTIPGNPQKKMESDKYKAGLKSFCLR